MFLEVREAKRPIHEGAESNQNPGINILDGKRASTQRKRHEEWLRSTVFRE